MRKLFLLIPAMLLALATYATVPSTDFSGGYSFVADDATLEGNIELNTLTENHYLRYFDRSVNGTASWEVSVTKPCLVSVTLNMIDNSWNYDESDNTRKSYKNGGHTFKVRILDGETPKDSVAEGSESEVYTNIPLNGYLYFEKAGTYTIELLNSRAYSKCGIASITLTSESILETNFASAYALAADAAVLSGGTDASKFLLETSVTPHYIRYADHSQPGPVAEWKICATRACYVNVTLNFADNSAFYSGNKHIMEVQLYNGYGKQLDTIAEGPAFDGDGFTENGVDKTLAGTLKIPAAGVYTIKMLNNRNHSKTGIYGITLSYAGGAVQNMPGTTDINESGYAGGTRADGKFTIPGGKQDKAWIEWNVAFASAANYNVKLNINSGNGKKFTVALQDANGNDVVTPLYLNDGGTGTPVSLDMGSMMVPKGNYTLKVTNNEPWSDAEWISVQFVRAGGGLVDIPGNLTFDEVILSSRAWIDNDSILFTARGDEGHNESEYAKWNVHSEGGWYSFTVNGFNANANNENGQQYTISVLSSDETTTLKTKTSAWAHPGPSSCTTEAVELPEGNYVVKVQNIEWGSTGRVLSVVSSYIGGAVQTISASTNTTLPIAEAWFSGCTRDNNKTYIQYPSSGTSSAWIKWNIETTENAFYDITANISTAQAHGFTVAIYEDEDAEPVASVTEGTWVNTQGEALALELGRVNLAGGKNYVVKVTNAPSGSVAKLVNIVFAPVVTTVTALPGTLVPSDAILSTRAWVDTEGDVDSLLFTARGDEGYASNSDYTTAESGKWKVSVAEKGKFVFTANVLSLNGHNFRISVLDEAESNTLCTKQEAEAGHYDYHNEGSDWQVVTDAVTLEAGTYIVKIENYKDSRGRVLNIVAEYATITLDEMAESNSVITENANTLVNIQLTRSFTANMYNTCCLPFAVSSTLCKEIFGNDVEIYTLNEAVVDGAVLNVTLHAESDIYQGTPVFIKTSQDIVNPTFENVRIVRETPASTHKTNANLVGTFVKTTLEGGANILYLGPDNTLYYPEIDTPIKGMRAWFVIHDAPVAAPMIKRMRIIENTNIETEINIVGAEQQTLKTIENGQLIIFRDSQKYNVMGVKLQ